MTDSRGPAALVKCLVWDLDGTLWRGTLADGDAGELAPAVLDVIRTLDRRGVLQSVASRNDPDRARARLQRLGVADYLVLPRIGWAPKAESVRAIAAGLGVAEPALAVVDGQPGGCAEVAVHLPAVRCYPARQVPALPSLPEFSPAAVTPDGRRRRERYQAGFRREAARSGFPGPDAEFLRTLDLTMLIGAATSADLPRVAELTQRAGQLTATGAPRAVADLRAELADPRHLLLLVTMADRFGPHGTVGIALLHRHRPAWHLTLLATTCRAVPFGTGPALLGWLLDRAAAAGVHLVADFRATDRNGIMAAAYGSAGLVEQPCGCQAGLAAAEPGVRRLHVTPARRDPPGTIRIRGADPGRSGPDGDLHREWMPAPAR